MGIKKFIKKYKDYESKELARRIVKKRKIAAYKSLMKKKLPKIKFKGKFSKKDYTKAIGNPYGVKL